MSAVPKPKCSSAIMEKPTVNKGPAPGFTSGQALMKLKELLPIKLSIFLTTVFLVNVLCLFLFALRSPAQEQGEEEDRAIDLPPVKIEIVDPTQLSISKEKFRGFERPEPELYAPMGQKERLWYLPPTSAPKKVRETPVKAKKDFLLSLSAYPGIPAALTYQLLLVKEFGNTGVLADVGREILWSDRSAKLADDPTKKQDKSAIDKFRGALTYETKDAAWRGELSYNAKDLGYLGAEGTKYPNNRSLVGMSVNWDQKLIEDVKSSLNISLSGLRMEGPYPNESGDGLDLRTDLGVRVAWPGVNPLDTRFGFEYFAGDGGGESFKLVSLRTSLRDNYIRIRPFVLSAGIELALSTFSSVDSRWKFDPHLNPYVLLTSQIGDRTTLQLGAERALSSINLREIYLDKDYVRFSPNLNVESAWQTHVSLQYKRTQRLTAVVKLFDRQINDMVILKKSEDDIISWIPISGDAHIFGFNPVCDLRFGRQGLCFEYVHEFHDTKIPYRPEDRGSLTLAHLLPHGFEISLSGEFYGVRQTDEEGASLPGYFLCIPSISRSFSENASAFLMAEFYFGSNGYQIWKGYELPRATVDFGVTVKF